MKISKRTRLFLVAGASLGVVFGSVLTAFAAPATVSNVTSPTADGRYSAGGVISIYVQFSTTTMVVTGSPTLTLNSGGTAVYSSTSGSSTIFTYTVGAGQTSADLDYSATSSISLNGGTIKDGGAVDATTTLPVPGAAGSLGANKALVIDTTAPTENAFAVSTTTIAEAQAGGTFTVTSTFSEAMDSTVQPTITFSPNEVTAGTLTFSSQAWSSASSVFAVVYTIADANDIAPSVSVSVSGAKDVAGNTMTATTSAAMFSVDTVAPETVVMGPAGGNFPAGVAISVILSSSGSANIHYTTNGTTPTCITGSVYNGSSLTVTPPTTVKAVGCDASNNSSAVASYLFDTTTGGSGYVSGGSSVPPPAPVVIVPVVVTPTPSTPTITLAPVVAQGTTPQSTLNALMAQLKLLLAQAQQQGVSLPAGSSAYLSPTGKHLFMVPLKMGSRGADVTALQQFLSAYVPNVYPSKIVSGYYGSLTVQAVGLLQENQGIAQPGDPGYGAVGPKTRAFLNQ